MKAIILAAGKGTRLGKDIPKALVDLFNGTNVLDLQLNALSGIVDLKDIILVTGFRKKIFKQKYHYLQSVYNPDFENTNTSMSLLKALDEVKNDDVIFMNGDVVFDPEILSILITKKNHNLVCVNKASVEEEEVKYSLDQNEFINEISKNVCDPCGEAVGVNFIRKDSLEIFKESLGECEKQDYFEKGIEIAIEKGVKFKPLNIDDLFCLEIDFPEDLEQAKKYLQHGHEKGSD